MTAYCNAQRLNYQTFTYHVGRKKKKVWTAFGAGTATYTAELALVLVSGNN